VTRYCPLGINWETEDAGVNQDKTVLDLVEPKRRHVLASRFPGVRTSVRV